MGYEKVSFPVSFSFLDKYTSLFSNNFIIYEGIIGDQFNFYNLLYLCITGSKIIDSFFLIQQIIAKEFFLNTKTNREKEFFT